MQKSVILTGRVSRRKDFRKDFRVGCWQQGARGRPCAEGGLTALEYGSWRGVLVGIPGKAEGPGTWSCRDEGGGPQGLSSNRSPRHRPGNQPKGSAQRGLSCTPTGPTQGARCQSTKGPDTHISHLSHS